MTQRLGDLVIERQGRHQPPRVVLYGDHGIGKSSFGASARKPIFIQVEDGIDNIEVARFEQCRSKQAVTEQIYALISHEHEFETVVVDTADRVERLIHQSIAADHYVGSASDLPYGRGYKAAEEQLNELLGGLDLLRNDKSMTVIVLAHAKIKRFEDPTADPYDRYVPDMHDSAAALLCEWADVVGFLTYEISTKTIDAGFGRKITRGLGTGTRVMYLEARPGFIAKNRYDLPPSLVIPKEGGWTVFEDALRASVELKGGR